MQHKIGIFLTGGTIDSYNKPELDGLAVPLKESLVKKYIESLQLPYETVFIQICLKDSQELTDNDKEQLIKEIERCGMQHNIVTHGTYTMLDTARYLFNKGVGKDKVVVVTGSMSTLLGSIYESGFLRPSDAQFNLGYAIGETFNLDNGVYQAMDGETFKQPDQEWCHDADGAHRKK